MLMARPPCLFKKGKQVLENFMVSIICRPWICKNCWQCFLVQHPLFFTFFVHFCYFCTVKREDVYLTELQTRVFLLKVWHLTGVIFPSLLQLQKGITDLEDRKQKDLCNLRYKRKDELEKGKSSEIDIQREEECGICMEMNSKVVLPNCSHSLCLKCYRDWYALFSFFLAHGSLY